MKKYCIVLLCIGVMSGCVAGGPYIKTDKGLKFHRSSVKYWQDSKPVSKSYVPDAKKYPLYSGRVMHNWKHDKKGYTVKKGTKVFFYENRKVKQFTLAENWKAPGLGIVLAADTEVCLYENGNNKSFVPAEDFKSGNNGMLLMAGKKIVFHKDKKDGVKELFLAEDWKDTRNGMTLKAGVKQEFYPQLRPKRVVLGNRWDHPSGRISMAAGSVVEYTQEEQLLRCTLAENFKLNDTVILRAGTDVEFYKNGNLKKGTFAKPWRDSETGNFYKKDVEYTF